LFNYLAQIRAANNAQRNLCTRFCQEFFQIRGNWLKWVELVIS
jgi:hypothetical protein